MDTKSSSTVSNSADDELLDYDQAARLLNVRRATLQAWTSRGIVPHLRLTGRTIRFNRTALRQWLEARTVTKR